jgi:predicted ATP-grasp superfamily ATP-dependent carboligase
VCLNKKKFNSFFSLKNDYFKLPKNKINKKNIIKPVEGHGSKNILVTKNKKIANFFLTLKKDFIIQEFIDGREFTVDCYFNKSNILENYLIRERMVKSNVSISSKIIKSDKKIEACIKYISKKMNFRGPINIQIIKHKKDLFLVEINPRLSGSISFSLEAGFDPFKLSTKEYLDHEIKVSHQLKTIYLHRYYEYIKKKKII